MAITSVSKTEIASSNLAAPANAKSVIPHIQPYTLKIAGLFVLYQGSKPKWSAR